MSNRPVLRETVLLIGLTLVLWIGGWFVIELLVLATPEPANEDLVPGGLDEIVATVPYIVFRGAVLLWIPAIALTAFLLRLRRRRTRLLVDVAVAIAVVLLTQLLVPAPGAQTVLPYLIGATAEYVVEFAAAATLAAIATAEGVAGEPRRGARIASIALLVAALAPLGWVLHVWLNLAVFGFSTGYPELIRASRIESIVFAWVIPCALALTTVAIIIAARVKVRRLVILTASVAALIVVTLLALWVVFLPIGDYYPPGYGT